MSEKRKRSAKIVAEIYGKDGARRKVVVELFDGHLFSHKTIPLRNRSPGGFRVRIGGKWRCGDNLFTMTQIMAELRGLILTLMKKRHIRRNPQKEEL